MIFLSAKKYTVAIAIGSSDEVLVLVLRLLISYIQPNIIILV